MEYYLSRDALDQLSTYWEAVRAQYRPFESDMRAGASAVYRNEVPGGQYTNLREQARGLKLEHKWPEILKAYAEVNQLFGDIIKVTPTSKVVGDMALFMVSNDLTADAILSSTEPLGFPRSVVEMLQGLRERIVNGQSFEELARLNSDDGSAQRGGDLGVEDRMGHDAGAVDDDLDILAGGVEDLQDLGVGHQFVERRQIDPLGQGVDGGGVVRPRDLGQAELGPVGALAHEFGVDRHELGFRQRLAELSKFVGLGDELHWGCSIAGGGLAAKLPQTETRPFP